MPRISRYCHSNKLLRQPAQQLALCDRKAVRDVVNYFDEIEVDAFHRRAHVEPISHMPHFRSFRDKSLFLFKQLRDDAYAGAVDPISCVNRVNDIVQQCLAGTLILPADLPRKQWITQFSLNLIQQKTSISWFVTNGCQGVVPECLSHVKFDHAHALVDSSHLVSLARNFGHHFLYRYHCTVLMRRAFVVFQIFQKHRSLHRVARQAVKFDRKRHISSLCVQIENHNRSDEQSVVYSIIKKLSTGGSSTSISLVDETGVVCYSDEDVIACFSRFMQHIYNSYEVSCDFPLPFFVSDRVESFRGLGALVDDVVFRSFMHKAKMGKAALLWSLVAEFWRLVAHVMLDFHVVLLRCISYYCQYPMQWVCSLAVKWLKLGKNFDRCDSFRDVNLMGPMCKQFHSLIRRSLVGPLWEFFGHSEYGFIGFRSTSHAVVHVSEFSCRLRRAGRSHAI